MKRSSLVISALIIVGLVSSSFFTKGVPPFKNLQILHANISEHDLDSIMHLYTTALGTGCEFCHTQAGRDLDFASDANKLKLKAREMMRMTDSINHVFFPEGHGTGQTLTCYSCHHGQTFPARFAPEKPAWLPGGH